MNKRRLLFILFFSSLAISLILCGTVFAYMFRQTEYTDNKFVPANVSCKVIEAFDGTQKTSIQIQNTGNIDEYLRVRLISYWVNANGDTVAKPSIIPEVEMTAGWIKGANNTYYYKTPVKPGELTASLLSAPIILEIDENGYTQVIEVFAEAIQSKPHSAATSSWGVTIDSNGHIVSQ